MNAHATPHNLQAETFPLCRAAYPVFERFDVEPLAAASIAQVHRARTKAGDEVIVKIRRPGIREIIEADLRLLDRLAAFDVAALAQKPAQPGGQRPQR